MRFAIAFAFNFFVPGLGSFVLGRWFQGTLQIVLTLMAFVLIVSVFLTFFGLVLFALSWLYALAVWMFQIWRHRQSKTALK